jgi:hypothetical protein
MDLVHEFQNRTPSLEFNGLTELRHGDVQLRAGIQKFAWGGSTAHRRPTC